MNDEAALLKAICADPADDTARLVFADLLDENGGKIETAWAAFIRAHVRLSGDTAAAGDVPNVRRYVTEYWLQRFALRLGFPHESGVALEGWERGFPGHMAVEYPRARRDWDALVDRVPFRHVRISGIEDEAVEDVVTWARLDRLITLDLTTWDGTLIPRTLSARGVAALVTCPALVGLESLGLSYLNATDRVADLILGAPHLTRLRELALRTTTMHANNSSTAVSRLRARFGPNAVA